MYRILSIDGGGMRGLIPAIALERLERQLGRPLAQVFDLVAGTSTGGIIATAAAAQIPMAKVRQLYRDKGRVIFTASIFKRLASLGGLADEKYAANGLEACLDDLFGARRLSELQTALLVPACTFSGAPHFFKARAAQTDPSDDYLLADVCRATAAAPTFFPPAEVQDLAGAMTHHLIDGGLAANSPAMCAVADAVRCGVRLEDIVLVSLGTGEEALSMTIGEANRCGLISGGARVIRIVFAGPGHAVDYQCRQLLGSTRYVRLQQTLPHPLEMDATDTESLATMEAVAAQICESPEFERMLDLCRAA